MDIKKRFSFFNELRKPAERAVEIFGSGEPHNTPKVHYQKKESEITPNDKTSVPTDTAVPANFSRLTDVQIGETNEAPETSDFPNEIRPVDRSGNDICPVKDSSDRVDGTANDEENVCGITMIETKPDINMTTFGASISPVSEQTNHADDESSHPSSPYEVTSSTNTDVVSGQEIENVKEMPRGEKIVVAIWVLSGIALLLTLLVFSTLGLWIGTDEHNNCQDTRNSIRVACIMLAASGFMLLLLVVCFVIGLVFHGQEVASRRVKVFLIVVTILLILVFLANIGLNFNALSEAIVTITNNKCNGNITTYLITTVTIYLVIVTIFIVTTVYYIMHYRQILDTE